MVQRITIAPQGPEFSLFVMVHGGHAEIQMLFNKTDQLAGGHIPVHQSPVAHHKTGKLRALLIFMVAISAKRRLARH